MIPTWIVSLMAVCGCGAIGTLAGLLLTAPSKKQHQKELNAAYDAGYHDGYDHASEDELVGSIVGLDA